MSALGPMWLPALERTWREMPARSMSANRRVPMSVIWFRTLRTTAGIFRRGSPPIPPPDSLRLMRPDGDCDERTAACFVRGCRARGIFCPGGAGADLSLASDPGHRAGHTRRPRRHRDPDHRTGAFKRSRHAFGPCQSSWSERHRWDEQRRDSCAERIHHWRRRELHLRESVSNLLPACPPPQTSMPAEVEDEVGQSSEGLERNAPFCCRNQMPLRRGERRRPWTIWRPQLKHVLAQAGGCNGSLLQAPQCISRLFSVASERPHPRNQANASKHKLSGI